MGLTDGRDRTRIIAICDRVLSSDPDGMEKQLPQQRRGFKRQIRHAVGPITSVHQHARLTRVLSVRMALERRQEEEEEEWLTGRTLDALGLTLEQIKKSAKRSAEGKPPVYCSDLLGRKEADVRELLQSYQSRLQWQGSGSRALFGVVRGSSVAVVVDCSDQALSDEATAEQLMVGLPRLLSEQLARKSQLLLVRYGSVVESGPCVDLRHDRQEGLAVAADWIDGCDRGRGTSNLLSALKYALRLKQAETVCCVVASKPDQEHQVVEDFVLQSLVGHSRPHLHFVSFGCDPASRQLMKTLIRAVGGAYHHNVIDDDGTFHDSGYGRVAAELRKIQNTLHELQQLRAKLNNASATADNSMDESPHLQDLVPSSDLAWLSFLTLPLTDPDKWACPSSDPFERLPSREWLRVNSLRARHLEFYQVLAPDSFCPRQGSVALTGHAVQSQIYNVMLEVEWPDGSLRRVHVDVPKLDEYCDQLDDVIGVYQERLQGLTLGSRRKFGVISDSHVVLLVDTSSMVSGHLAQLQKSLKKLLQEQFLPSDSTHQVVRQFNVVRFGSVCEAWRTQLVECSADNLEEAWWWIAQWVCGGTRNLRSGIEGVFGCVEWAGSLLSPKESIGVYLITGGLPDQEEGLLCEDLSRRVAGSGIVFNVVYFENDAVQEEAVLSSGRHGTPDQVAECLQTLAVAGGGRFHHYTLTDLVGSDDALLMEEELDHARTCQQKALQLLQRFDELCREQSKGHCKRAPDHVVPPPLTARHSPLPQPRHTLATAARLNLLSSKLSAKEGRGRGRDRSWSAPHQTPVVGFYLGKGLGKGLAATGRKNRRSGGRSHLQESLVRDVTLHTSSAEWLARYSLRALGLDLDQYRAQGSGRVQRSGCGKPQVFLHPSKKGGLVPLGLSRTELVECARGLKMATCGYNKRLKWLTSGSRHCFGCTSQDKLVVLLDSSGSMAAHYQEACAAMLDLVGEQLVPSGGRFNVGTFGGEVQYWQADLTMATKDILASLSDWLSSIHCHGNTRLLEAIQVTVDRFPTCSLHVVSDGGVDHSEEFFFKRLLSLPPPAVHTTAFRCTDRGHCSFLKELAERTSGRHHMYPAALSCSSAPKATPSNPQGHDVQLLLQEIQCAERWIEETRDLL